MRRRDFLASLASAAVVGGLGLSPTEGLADTGEGDERRRAFDARVRDLESAAQGRLGVHLLDLANGHEYGYRSDERFLMLSSFKLMASALVLHRADTGHDSLDRRIPYTKADLADWSPVTDRHVDGHGLTLAELCEATITTSDNTAANLILSSYGGPTALTAFARQLGDTVTRLDRFEPELNLGHADQMLDTTTPRAMLGLMRKLTLGDALSPTSREQLQRWLLANTTGGRRLKAGIPADWRIGDKTGTHQTGANDIGLIWPPGRPPLLVTAYLAESAADARMRDATIAAVGRIARDFVA